MRVSTTPRRVQDGWTAIYCAAYNPHWDLVRLLLDHKADPSIPANVRLIGACLTIALSVSALGLGSGLELGLGLGLGLRLGFSVRVRVRIRV